MGAKERGRRLARDYAMYFGVDSPEVRELSEVSRSIFAGRGDDERVWASFTLPMECRAAWETDSVTTPEDRATLGRAFASELVRVVEAGRVDGEDEPQTPAERGRLLAIEFVNRRSPRDMAVVAAVEMARHLLGRLADDDKAWFKVSLPKQVSMLPDQVADDERAEFVRAFYSEMAGEKPKGE